MLVEDWRRVWRDGLAPVLPTAGLEALREALRTDDPKLTQGSTTTPPPLMCVQDWPCEAGCAVAYPVTVGLGGFMVATVGDVEQGFAKACFDCDMATGESASVRHFLNWFDDSPRDEMRRDLLPEVERELERRAAPAAA